MQISANHRRIDVEVANNAETERVSAWDVLDDRTKDSRGVGIENVSESRNDGNLVDIWTTVYGTWEALYTLSDMGM